ncbi:MAG: hypothetical protein AB7L09_02030 [Nitrospira sp.]
MKVYFEVTLKGFIDVDTEDMYEAERIVEEDTPVADLVDASDLSEGHIYNVEAQVGDA